MRPALMTVALLLALAAAVPFARAHEPIAPGSSSPTTPVVQIALLLDTSNSMDGLINQAKTHLWSVVNEFATARRDGQAPTLQVALFEYGNSGLPAEEGYIRQVVQLTSDLDAISEALFSLTTHGGDEYCGHVIREATDRLAWSPRRDAFKAIFIAGNEPFTQGSVDYVTSCRTAIAQGILINTIHCGDYQIGIDTQWKHGAELADGTYLHIDQDRTLPPIVAPQDERLGELNDALNATYVWYGVDARENAARQLEQDANAASTAPQAIAGRIAAKSSALYAQADKDLVDAFAADEQALAELDADALPDVMRSMTEAQRVAYVKQQAEKRAKIQHEIQALSKLRAAHVAEVRKQQAEAGEATLGDAILTAVREQAKAAGYEVSE